MNVDKQAPCYFNLKWKVWSSFDGTECTARPQAHFRNDSVPSLQVQELIILSLDTGHLMHTTSRAALQILQRISTAERGLFSWCVAVKTGHVQTKWMRFNNHDFDIVRMRVQFLCVHAFFWYISILLSLIITTYDVFCASSHCFVCHQYKWVPNLDDWRCHLCALVLLSLQWWNILYSLKFLLMSDTHDFHPQHLFHLDFSLLSLLRVINKTDEIFSCCDPAAQCLCPAEIWLRWWSTAPPWRTWGSALARTDSPSR